MDRGRRSRRRSEPGFYAGALPPDLPELPEQNDRAHADSVVLPHDARLATVVLRPAVVERVAECGERGDGPLAETGRKLVAVFLQRQEANLLRSTRNWS